MVTDRREKEVTRSVHSYGDSSRGRAVILHCLIPQKTNRNPTTDKKGASCLIFLVFLREAVHFNFCYEQNTWDFLLHLQISLLMPAFWLGIEFIAYQTESRNATHYTMTFIRIFLSTISTYFYEDHNISFRSATSKANPEISNCKPGTEPTVCTK